MTLNWRITFMIDREEIEIVDLNYEDYHQECGMRDPGLRMINPPHPGSFLRIELKEGRGLTVTEAAEALHVTRPALSAVLNGKASLTSDMALRFEKAFGFAMETLMRMQHAYDIAQARQHADEIDVPPYVPKAKTEPQPNLA